MSTKVQNKNCSDYPDVQISETLLYLQIIKIKLYLQLEVYEYV